MDSVAHQQNAKGSLSGTNVNFFGPAMNVSNADTQLAKLQNRPAMTPAQQSNATLHYMCHVADPVCGSFLVGRNAPTGGTIPMGNGTTVDWSAEGTGGSVSPGSTSLVWERLRAATGQENTSHNLYFVNYGNFKPNLRDPQKLDLLDKYWSNGNPQLKPVTR